jgi:hypothetical protein
LVAANEKGFVQVGDFEFRLPITEGEYSCLVDVL